MCQVFYFLKMKIASGDLIICVLPIQSQISGILVNHYSTYSCAGCEKHLTPIATV